MNESLSPELPSAIIKQAVDDLETTGTMEARFDKLELKNAMWGINALRYGRFTSAAVYFANHVGGKRSQMKALLAILKKHRKPKYIAPQWLDPKDRDESMNQFKGDMMAIANGLEQEGY